MLEWSGSALRGAAWSMLFDRERTSVSQAGA